MPDRNPQWFGRMETQVEVVGQKVHVLQSCHSTWVFDPDRGRFRRVPRGVDITMPSEQEWHAYFRLDIDQSTGAFAILLDPAGTRMLRSWIHEAPCRHCAAGEDTGEWLLGRVHQAG